MKVVELKKLYYLFFMKLQLYLKKVQQFPVLLINVYGVFLLSLFSNMALVNFFSSCSKGKLPGPMQVMIISDILHKI